MVILWYVHIAIKNHHIQWAIYTKTWAREGLRKSPTCVAPCLGFQKYPRMLSP